MTKKKNYKVVCDDLNLVIFVRGFSLEEERSLYMEVRKLISKAQAPIDIEEYKRFVVSKLLLDSETVLQKVEEGQGDPNEVIDSLYEAIINVYPPFSLEFICNDLNSDTFFKSVDSTVGRVIKDQIRKMRGETEESCPISTHSIQLSSIEDIQNLESFLRDNIVGQRPAIEALVKSLKIMASGLCKHSSFFFVGPTGVGKTELAKHLGSRFSGNYYKINCAEYAGAHEYAKLIGAPPGYVGHAEKSLLGEKAAISNRWVLLFDEVEKAHSKLHDFLLSLLDDGTVTDNLGNILDFSESIFIFTSNQGVSEIKYEKLGFTGREEDVRQSEISSEVIRTSVKKNFSPEFLNRLDDMILFNSLSKSDIKKIVALELAKIPIQQTQPLIDFIVERGYSQEYGARNIARFIKNNVSTKVADAILNKQVPKKVGEYYTPRMIKGEVKIIDTRKYEASS
jgi:ATP-dependent Clp protease ATP-binding subunit ClpA